MKARLQVRALHYPQLAQNWATGMCQLLDSAIAPAATCFLLLGLVAAVVGLSGAANFLVAAGLLFHMTIWFERWWRGTPRD